MEIIAEKKAIRDVKNVAATMAIENMYVSADFMDKMIKVAKGELSSEQIRQDILKKYGRQ